MTWYGPHDFGRTLEQRLWEKVARGGPDECWPWMAYRNPRGGYGYIAVAGKDLRASRVAWELTNGPIPAGLHVCHRCDNPPCVNPAHLFLGDHQANMADMVAKGRLVTHARSEHWKAKLTESDVRTIRASSEGSVALARRYGLNRGQVWRIRTGRQWNRPEPHHSEAEATA